MAELHVHIYTEPADYMDQANNNKLSPVVRWGNYMNEILILLSLLVFYTKHALQFSLFWSLII